MIECLNDTTFCLKNEELYVDVEIGDSKQKYFFPQIKLMKWENETNFSLRLIDDLNETKHYIKDDVVFWEKNDGSLVARFYNLKEDEDLPEGGFEFDIAVKSPIDKIKFSMKSKGFDFFYQGELTEKEIADGCSRPENVIGSYAVYHKTKNCSYSDGKDYKTGKAFHIYRPYAIEPDGNKIWCSLKIDEENELLTIDIPSDAKFPLLIDPTIGNTTAGGSSQTIVPGGGIETGDIFGTKINENNCILTHAAIYIKQTTTNYHSFKLNAWKSTLHSWEASGSSTTSINVNFTTPQWMYAKFNSTPLIKYFEPFIEESSNFFYIGGFNYSTTYSPTIYYDNGSVGDGYFNSAAKNFSNVIPPLSTNVSRRYSCYVTIESRIKYIKNGVTKYLSLFRDKDVAWTSEKNLHVYTNKSEPTFADTPAIHYIPLSDNINHPHRSDLKVNYGGIDRIVLKYMPKRTTYGGYWTHGYNGNLLTYDTITNNPYYPSYNIDDPTTYFNQVYFLFMVIKGGASNAPNTPTGWTRLIYEKIGDIAALIYYKKITVDDEMGNTTYTFTFPQAVYAWLSNIMFNNVDTINPVYDLDFTKSSSSTSVIASAYTPSVKYERIIWVGAVDGAYTITKPSILDDVVDNNGYNLGFRVGTKEILTSNIGNSINLTGSITTARPNIGIRFILRRLN